MFVWKRSLLSIKLLTTKLRLLLVYCLKCFYMCNKVSVYLSHVSTGLFSAWGFGAPPLGQTSTRVEEPVVLPPTTAANPQIGLFPPHGCFPRPGPKKPQFGAFGPAVMGPGGFAQPCVEGYPKQNPFGSLHAFASSNAFGNSIGFGTSNGYGTTFGTQQSSCVPFSQPAPQPEPIQVTNSETVPTTNPEPTPAAQPQPAAPETEPTPHHPRKLIYKPILLL